jgi:hypothetical protein
VINPTPPKPSALTSPRPCSPAPTR